MARTDPNADVQNLNRRCAPTKTHGSHENSHVTFELRIGQQIQHRTSHRFWSTLESQLTSDLASLLGMHIGPRIGPRNLHRTPHQNSKLTSDLASDVRFAPGLASDPGIRLGHHTKLAIYIGPRPRMGRDIAGLGVAKPCLFCYRAERKQFDVAAPKGRALASQR